MNTVRVKKSSGNGVMKLPKRRNLISLVFTCLCISKSLLIKCTFHNTL